MPAPYWTIAQRTLTINHVSEIVTHVRIDLVHGWPPNEAFIHLCGALFEHVVDYLIAKEGLWAVDRGRSLRRTARRDMPHHP